MNANNLSTCTLCKSEYQLPVELQGEIIPNGFFSSILFRMEYPWILGVYIWFLQVHTPSFLVHYDTLYSLLLTYVGSVEIGWLLAMTWYIQQVRSISLYREGWRLHYNSICLYFHALCVIGPFLGFYPAVLAIPFSMNLIWAAHVSILIERNEELLAVRDR